MKRRLLPALLLLAILTSVGVSKEVSIVYWGDRLGADFPRPPIAGDSLEQGGAWQLAGMVEVFRQAIPATFVFAAGGELVGSPASIHTKGLSSAKILSAIGPDVYSPGVFDFGLGVDALKACVAKAKIPVILANAYVESSGQLFSAYQVVEREGLKVAVTGVTSLRTKEIVERDAAMNLTLADPVPSVREFVSVCKDKADLLVVLSQLGWHADSALAVAVPGIDFIIEGHIGTYFDPPKQVGKTTILSSASKGLEIARLILNVDTISGAYTIKRHEILPVRKGFIERDNAVKQVVVEQAQRYVRDRGSKVGELMTDWNLDSKGSCNLPQWATDALLSISGAARIGVLANQDFGRSVKRGVLFERDIEEIFPVPTTIVAFQITGKELRYAVDRQRKGGPFLTWSGMKVISEKGKQTQIVIGNSLLTDREEFAVVTTGQFWDRFEEYTGLDPDARPTFFFPVTSTSYMVDAVKNQKMITTPLDDRWR